MASTRTSGPATWPDQIGDAVCERGAVGDDHESDEAVRPSSRVFYNVEQHSTMKDSMIQSVDRAVRILKTLSGGTGRLGVSEIAVRLDLAKGTVHGLLRTLQSHGLVEQHADSDKYQLGPELLNLSNRYLDLNELRSRALAWSELLALRTQEAVRVAVLHGRGALVVHHVFRPDSTLQILEVGSVLPLHATALGKAAIAYLDEDTVEELLTDELTRLTGHTLTGPAAVRRELEFVRDARLRP